MKGININFWMNCLCGKPDFEEVMSPGAKVGLEEKEPGSRNLVRGGLAFSNAKRHDIGSLYCSRL